LSRSTDRCGATRPPQVAVSRLGGASPAWRTVGAAS
jgi:hypothetical protein